MPRKKTQRTPSQGNVERLASFTKINPRPVVEVDAQGNIIYANQSAMAFFPDLMAQGLMHPYLKDFKKIVSFLIHHPGKSLPRDIKIKQEWFRQFFYYLPKSQSVLAYGTDVTDRKTAEEALHQSELKYRSLFNKMTEGYILCELVFNKQQKPVDCKFIEVNPSFERLVGFNRVNLIGKRLLQLFPQSPLIKKYGKTLLTDKPVHIEYYSEPLQKWLAIFAFKTGEQQFAALLIDITHQKSIEKEKDNFISILSHELRNPLTPILAAAQIISLQAVKAELKESAAVIERQSKLMAQLLDDLLDISRMSRKTMKLEKRLVNVNNVIESVVETIAPLIKHKNQTLSVSLPKKPIAMMADPVRLGQIFVNLVGNASKYTNPGGTIWIKAMVKKGAIEVLVKDNGVGIPLSRIKKIFTLFYTENHPFNDLGSMGIGLNIAKHLVKMHGGRMTVASPGENKGSTFTVIFPMLKTYALKPAAAEKRASAKGARALKVLIVDDNKDITGLLSRALAQFGHTVKTAYSGEEALAMVKKFQPSIALIDIGLPRMNGYEVANKMRQASNDNIKLVAMTGYGQQKDKLRSKEACFNHHLVKPVDMATLKKILSA